MLLPQSLNISLIPIRIKPIEHDAHVADHPQHRIRQELPCRRHLLARSLLIDFCSLCPANVVAGKTNTLTFVLVRMDKRLGSEVSDVAGRNELEGSLFDRNFPHGGEGFAHEARLEVLSGY